jgi:hypothetical protein
MNYRGLLLIVVLALLLPAAPAAACQPVEAGYYMSWYQTNLWVDSAPLPAGVSVGPTLASRSISLSNSGATPLYVLAPSDQAEPDQALALPAGWGAIYKLERGALFTWVDGRWVSDGRSTYVEVGLESAAISPPLVASTPSGPDRPASVPDPVPARLSLLYDNERLDVAIALEYSLNPHYDLAEYDRIMGEPCGFASMGNFILQALMGLGLCVVALVVTAIVVWRGRSAPRPPTIQ